MVEDLLGKLELVIFPDSWEKHQEAFRRALADAEPIVVTGEVEIKDEVEVQEFQMREV